MRLAFCLSFLLLINHAHGESFDLHAKPSLKAMVNDFYEMMTLFPSYPQGISELAIESSSILPIFDQFKETCPRFINLKCKPQLLDLKLKIKELKEKSFSINRNLNFQSSAYLNSISGQRQFLDFEEKIDQLLSLIDSSTFTLGLEKSSQIKTADIFTQIHRLKTIADLMVIEFTPFQYRNEFRQFYFHFILPVSKQFHHETGDLFMKRSNEELNFHFHHFVMNLTKKNKKTPEGMSPYLNTMTNRWNVVTKIYQ